MTSEIAVLNRQCAVLAADSAMTAGGKIFNSVSKVFALSKHHPVGVMVYSSAQVMGVPVETVIKEFRRAHGRETCEHLESYATAFEAFLRDDSSLFGDEARRQSMASLAWERTNELREAAYKRLAFGYGHPTKSEARAALLDALEEHERDAAGFQSITVASPSRTRREVRAAIEPECGAAIARLRGHFPVSAAAESRIRGLVLRHCLCNGGSGPETGFVIAGFGERDVFPRLRAFEFCHSYLGVHKVESRVEANIGPANGEHVARIEPFGQRDVIDAFTHGIHRDYSAAVGSFIGDFVKAKKEQFPNAPAVAAFVEAMGTELGQGLTGALEKITVDDFLVPLLTVVGTMPKDELAVLAEALINLTALKRRASRDAETVGGPVDVAVISKGDGLIWVKRKHYFDAKLNPAFSARYLEAGDES